MGGDFDGLHAANNSNVHATNIHAANNFCAFHDCLPNHYPYLHAYSVSAYRRHAFEDEHAHASEGQHASEEGIKEGIKEGNEEEKGMLRLICVVSAKVSPTRLSTICSLAHLFRCVSSRLLEILL